MDEEVIVGSRVKALVITCGGVLFVALGGWLLGHGALAFIVGLSSIGFFGLCAILAALSVFKPNRLTLSSAGFRLERALRKPRFVAWTDLDSAFIWSYRMTRLVGYRYLPGRAPGDRVTALNQSLGLDGGLPTGWTIGPDVLLAKMLQRLDRSRTPVVAGGA